MKSPIAIIDIDGTLFRSSLAIEQMNQLVRDSVFPPEALEALWLEYSAWLNREGSYQEYIRKMIEVYGKHINGASVESVQQANRRMVQNTYKRVYCYTRKLLSDLKQKNYTIVAISGSPKGVVEEFQQYWNIDAVFGTIFEVNAGLYTGKVLFEPAREKKKILQWFLQDNGLNLDRSVGIGDTETDIGFLEEVAIPIAFNPNKYLKEVAEKRGWKIVLERKDVIWELNHSGTKL